MTMLHIKHPVPRHSRTVASGRYKLGSGNVVSGRMRADGQTVWKFKAWLGGRWKVTRIRLSREATGAMMAIAVQMIEKTQEG